MLHTLIVTPLKVHVSPEVFPFRTQFQTKC